jgi:hypothetical protein
MCWSLTVAMSPPLPPLLPEQPLNVTPTIAVATAAAVRMSLEIDLPKG